MKTIEINGVSHVGLREIEQHYGFCKTRAWKTLKASGIVPVRFATSFYYPLAEVVAFIKTM